MYYKIDYNHITGKILKKSINDRTYIDLLFKIQQTYIDCPDFVRNRIISKELYDFILQKKRVICCNSTAVSRKIWENKLILQNIADGTFEKVVIFSKFILIKCTRIDTVDIVCEFLKLKSKQTYLKNSNLKLLCIRKINHENIKHNLPETLFNYY